MAEPCVAKANIQLLIAGEYYDDPQRYEELIEELGIGDRLHLHTDFIPTEAVRYYFSAANLVAQTYKTATQSGISQMAYHFEKPMVVTRVGGLPEIVPHGEAGYVVDKDPAAIARAICDYFQNDRQAALTASMLVHKQKYSWDVMVDAIEKISFITE